MNGGYNKQPSVFTGIVISDTNNVINITWLQVISDEMLLRIFSQAL